MRTVNSWSLEWNWNGTCLRGRSRVTKTVRWEKTKGSPVCSGAAQCFVCTVVWQRRDRGRWSQLLDGDFLRTRRGKARRLSQRALRDVHRQVRDGMFAEGLRQRQRQRQRMHYCTHLVSGIDYYLLSIMTWRHGLYASRVQTSLSAASRNRNRPSGPGGPTLQATGQHVRPDHARANAIKSAQRWLGGSCIGRPG
jgi:hypothetical protein